ncbi:bestrophin-like domain [Nocardia sp. NPDC004278]
MLELINTLFLAVVAFVVVILWQEYDNAHNHTVAEAKALVDTYWAAHALPDPEHRRIQGLVRDYTDQVLTQEWPIMQADRRLSQPTQETLDSLRDAVASVNSTDPDVTELRTKAMDNLDAVAEARQDRAMDASYHLPGFLYAALWFGTVLLLCTAVLNGVEVTERSLLMTALLGVVVGSAATGSALLSCLLLLPAPVPPEPGLPLQLGPPVPGPQPPSIPAAPVVSSEFTAAAPAPAIVPEVPILAAPRRPPDAVVESTPDPIAWNLLELVMVMVVTVLTVVRRISVGRHAKRAE